MMETLKRCSCMGRIDGGGCVIYAGFPLFRADKIPWLFQFFFPFSSIFLMFYFFNWKLHPFQQIIHSLFKYHWKITNNFFLKFPQFSSILCGFPWLFQSVQNSLTFSWLENAFPLFPGFPVFPVQVGTLIWQWVPTYTCSLSLPLVPTHTHEYKYWCAAKIWSFALCDTWAQADIKGMMV